MSSVWGRPARPRGPAAQRAQAWKVSPGGAPEHEDPKVKCKDCGAFGHRARNLRCPIRRWQGALVLQPLGRPKEKENVPPRCAPAPSRGVPKACGSRLIPGRGSLPKGCPTTQDQKPQASAKDGKESWDSVRQPCRTRPALVLEVPVQPEEVPRAQPQSSPELVPVAGKTPGLSPSCVPASRSPAWAAARTPALAPSRKPRALIQFGCHSGSDGAAGERAAGKRAASALTDATHSSPKKRRLGPSPSPQGSSPGTRLGSGHRQDTLVPGNECPVHTPVPAQAHESGQRDEQGLERGSQPRAPSSHGQEVAACPGSPLPHLGNPVEVRPLTMVFRRLQGDHWSCGFLPVSSDSSVAAPEPPACSPPAVGPTPRPFSVLYEDLLVSSSSDESEQE